MIPREPLWVKSTGRISAFISAELQKSNFLHSIFLVPITTGFSFFLCLNIVKWIGELSLRRILLSIFEFELSESKSKWNVSSNTNSHSAATNFVWYLFFKNVRDTDIYSSSLGFTKSTNALPQTMLQLRYLLFLSIWISFFYCFFVLFIFPKLSELLMS